MNETEFAVALTSESSVFDHAIGWLSRHRFVNLGARASAIVAAIRTIAGSTLAKREIDRRCRVVLNSVHRDEALLRLIVAGVQGVDASALNAVRGALPAQLRPLAMVSQRLDGTAYSHESAIATIGPNSSCDPSEISPAQAPEALLVPTVVLIGTEFEHASNRAMLQRSEFHALGAQNLAVLWAMDKRGICGVVVATSAWQGLNEQQQTEALVELSSWSTFTYSRIALEGLIESVARKVPTLVEAGSGRAPERFFHGSNASLTVADIEFLQSSAALLAAAETTKFVPLDLSREEALLLRLIAGHRVALDDAVVRQLGAAQMHGGRSSARVFMLQVEQSRPFVVKLDSHAKLRKELALHQRWIAAWEPNVTEPIIHCHRGRSAISYRLQAHPDGLDRPAPTLEAELESLRAKEWWLPDESGVAPAVTLGETLGTAISRAAERLAELNKLEAKGIGEEFWLDGPAKHLIAHEIIGHDERTFELSSIASRAAERIAWLHDKGVVHGDIHGRNILLIDRLPAFIDFSASGPGNPLVDLVRLDATVRHLVMRALAGEKALTELYVALYVRGTPASTLLENHPTLAASPSCKLAVITAAKTRACALEVAAKFNAGLREYLSTVAVVATYTLAIRSPGSAIERAVLAAIAPTLLSDEAPNVAARAVSVSEPPRAER